MTARRLATLASMAAAACGGPSDRRSTADATPRQQAVTAVLRVADVGAAIATYGEAFGAVPRLVLRDRAGHIDHVELAIGASVVWVDRSVDQHPLALGGSNGYVEVPMPRPPAGWPRVGELVRDPFGHLWRPAAAVVPVLAIDPEADRGFYTRAFGLEAHGDRLRHGDGELALVAATRELASPRTLGGAALRVHLYVPRCEPAVERAVAAGASLRVAPALQVWGDRWAMVADPSGHTWGLGERVETLTQAAMQARIDRPGR